MSGDLARVYKSDKVEAAGCERFAKGIVQEVFSEFAPSLANVFFIKSGVEPKPMVDWYRECRIGGRAEGEQFIMRPALLVPLGFGVSARAGRCR